MNGALVIAGRAPPGVGDMQLAQSSHMNDLRRLYGVRTAETKINVLRPVDAGHVCVGGPDGTGNTINSAGKEEGRG